MAYDFKLKVSIVSLSAYTPTLGINLLEDPFQLIVKNFKVQIYKFPMRKKYTYYIGEEKSIIAFKPWFSTDSTLGDIKYEALK